MVSKYLSLPNDCQSGLLLHMIAESLRMLARSFALRCRFSNGAGAGELYWNSGEYVDVRDLT
eukprot:5762320-Prorocentrum_lima.AAC.1